MNARDAIARVLPDLPAGLVRWASAPTEAVPRLSSGLAELDALLGGGWPRGRMAVLRGGGTGAAPARSASAGTICAGATTLASMSVAAATRAGRVCAWVDGDGTFDPASLAATGADLARILWIAGPLRPDRALAAAEEVLSSAGFELVVLRAAGEVRGGGTAFLRLTRAAERSRATVLVVGDGATPVPGALPVRLKRLRPRWAGVPGTSRLLLGAQASADVEGVSGEIALSVQDALPFLPAPCAGPSGAKRQHVAALQESEPVPGPVPAFRLVPGGVP